METTLTQSMGSWGSYPKVFAIGHRYLADLFQDDVIVEEKVDGSQFSFGKFLGNHGEEVLKCRSRGAQLNIEAPDNMFVRGVEMVKSIQDSLTVGWTYSGEYLSKPKHNTLVYDRVPNNHVIIFDVRTGPETYLPYEEKRAEAERIGLETVPKIYEGKVDDLQLFRSLLDTDSVLGGQKVEGVVAKNYVRFGIDGKALMGKFVSELFKEVHAGDWKERNPTNKDVLEVLCQQYRTPARWQKSIQHLEEDGKLERDPRDIGKLFPAVMQDLKSECEAEIKDKLFAWAWPHLSRRVCQGLPEFYKDRLLEQQFDVDLIKDH